MAEQAFLENLHELDHKLNMIADQGSSEYPACQDVRSLLKNLKVKVGQVRLVLILFVIWDCQF